MKMQYFVLAGALFFAGVTFAAEWEPLPVGEGLPGWKPLGGAWTVEEGVIVGRAQKDENCWLLYEAKEFADFEMEFEFLTPIPVNGGVQFRSHWLPVLPFQEGVAADQQPHQMYGYQCNIETRQRSGTGKLIDENGRGPLVEPDAGAVNKLILQKKLKQKDWNSMRIVARGPSIELYLDGELVAKGEDEAYIKGYLAIQTYHMDFTEPVAEVRYRNLRIKDYGRDGTWRPLFDGQTLTGWKTWGEEEWVVENGAIIGRSGPKKSEGYLATEAQWEDFHVRASFDMLGEGNFGLFYHSSITLREDGYPIIAGVQGEVEPNYPTASGRIYESYKRGWLTPPDPKTVGALALRPAWNEIEIRTQGPRTTTWLNGVRVIDFHDPEPKLTKGSFALQLHTGGVDGITWRDILVKE